MAIHKLVLDDFLEDEFDLLAIHSTLAPYHIAYLLNQALQTNFKKRDVLKSFDFYEFKDTKNQTLWNLISNKGYTLPEKKDSLASKMLFTTDEKTVTYLIPEYKRVDYFIKIEQASYNIQNIISKINTIPKIITTFAINTEGLKSKNNLIFY